MSIRETLTFDVWSESKDRLQAYILKRVRESADADDILQNVFLKIHQKSSQLRDGERLYPWVFQITRNAITDFYRERNIVSDFIEESMEPAATPQPSQVEDDVLGWLEPMAAELPAIYRDALIMADIEGVSQKEISERLNISVSGAKSRVQRARERLKEILVKCCRIEFDRAGTIVEYKQNVDNCSVCH